MKISHMLIALICCVMGCSVASRNSIPKDFSVRIDSESIQPGAGGSSGILIKRHDFEDSTFIVVNYSPSSSNIKNVNYDLVQQLHQHISEAKLYRLNREYNDFDILDGGVVRITLTMNGKVKEIVLRNTIPDELRGFFDLINKILA